MIGGFKCRPRGLNNSSTFIVDDDFICSRLADLIGYITMCYCVFRGYF